MKSKADRNCSWSTRQFPLKRKDNIKQARPFLLVVSLYPHRPHYPGVILIKSTFMRSGFPIYGGGCRDLSNTSHRPHLSTLLDNIIHLIPHFPQIPTSLSSPQPTVWFASFHEVLYYFLFHTWSCHVVTYIFLIHLRPLYYVLHIISYFPIPYILYHQHYSSIFQMLRYFKRDIILADAEIKYIYARVHDSAEFQPKAPGSKDSKVCPSFKDLCPDPKMQRFTQASTQYRPRNWEEFTEVQICA